MTYTVPIPTPSNARAGDYGPPAVLSTTAGAVMTCYTQDDYFMASPPAALATNLFEGSVILSPKFLGMHCKEDAAPLLSFGTARSMDQGPQWRAMNPSSGVFVDAGLGQWLRAMKARGADTIYTVFRTPQWASARPAETGDPFGGTGGIAEPSDCSPTGPLGLFVTWLMQNYGSLIDVLEVWNEPKYNNSGSSFFSGTPAKLAECARTINLNAKAVKPSVQIIGCGYTGVTSNGVGSGIDFLGQFLAASDNNAGTGKQWIDAISVHTYTTPFSANFAQVAPIKGFIDTVKAANSIASMPVWCSEYGLVPVNQGTDNRGCMLTTPGPAPARIATLIRYTMLNVAAGMARSVCYSYGSAYMGWQSDPDQAAMNAEWNRWVAALNGAAVTRINLVKGGFQLACVINGQNVLI